VKTFLKVKGHADQYDNLTVKYERGRNPDLYLFTDNGDLIETIDLAPLTTDGIHDLLIKKGFIKKVNL
jgi:hypothetical protein